jgi:hypothetical protein
MASPGADSAARIHVGVAPIWHTCVLIVLFAAVDIAEMAGSRTASPPRAVAFYLGAIAFEWLVFAYVLWGIKLRRYPLATLISRGRAARYGRDAVVGVVIWFLWYVVESLAALGLSAVGVTNAGVHTRVMKGSFNKHSSY